MYIVIANFGNSSVALIQWIIETKLPNCTVLNVDTGWAATHWHMRIEVVTAWLLQHKLQWQCLKSIAPFAAWIRDRQEFPSAKFQWCAGLLKGLPINEWLEQHDSFNQATIVLPKRRAASRFNQQLTEWVTDSDYYNSRKIWHPLYNCSDEEFEALLKRSGMQRLTHRSLECDPCVRNQAQDFVRLDEVALQRVQQLERELGKTMFCPEDFAGAQGIKAIKKICESPSITSAVNYSEAFDMGCGSPWGCGE